MADTTQYVIEDHVNDLVTKDGIAEGFLVSDPTGVTLIAPKGEVRDDLCRPVYASRVGTKPGERAHQWIIKRAPDTKYFVIRSKDTDELLYSTWRKQPKSQDLRIVLLWRDTKYKFDDKEETMMYWDITAVPNHPGAYHIRNVFMDKYLYAEETSNIDLYNVRTASAFENSLTYWDFVEQS